MEDVKRGADARYISRWPQYQCWPRRCAAMHDDRVGDDQVAGLDTSVSLVLIASDERGPCDRIPHSRYEGAITESDENSSISFRWSE